MCVSCGCGRPNDDHGDSRNITLNDLDQAAIAAGTTRDKVLQNIMGGARNTSNQQIDTAGASSIAQSWPNGTNQKQSSDSELPADQPPTRPGQPGKQLGTESGTDWQESLQMGKTGHGGIQSPEQNY
jgi:hypothetical protein